MIEVKRTDSFIENDIIVNCEKIGEVELNVDKHEISRLCIFPPYQNKGHGTEVVKSLIGRGYKILWVRSDNERAIHVYEKCGFRKNSNVMFEMELEQKND